jgi:hypothetical protein
MCRCAEPSPQRLTWTRATPSSERTARSSRTVMTPSSAASRLGRSPRSRCERHSRISTIGNPVGRSIARTRHRSPTQMYASSGVLQATQSAGSSPPLGGSTSTGSARSLTRSSPSNGKDGQRVKSGNGTGFSGTKLTIVELVQHCLPSVRWGSGTGISEGQNARRVRCDDARSGPRSAPKVIHRSYPQAGPFHVKHDVERVWSLWITPCITWNPSAMFHVKRRSTSTSEVAQTSLVVLAGGDVAISINGCLPTILTDLVNASGSPKTRF